MVLQPRFSYIFHICIVKQLIYIENSIRVTMSLSDFKEMQKTYGGRFVAILNEEKIVASGATFNETLNKLQGMKLVNKAGLSIRFIRPTSRTMNM